jgi:hypothetical protein
VKFRKPIGKDRLSDKTAGPIICVAKSHKPFLEIQQGVTVRIKSVLLPDIGMFKQRSRRRLWEELFA